MIRLEHVSKTYAGDFAALAPTTIEFERGQFTVLVGLSGAASRRCCAA